MLRMGLIGIALLAPGLLGVSRGCFPLFNLDESRPDREPTTLGIALLSPTQSRSIPVNSRLPIQFSATNDTSDEAIVTVLVEERETFAQSIVAGGIRLVSGSTVETVEWDTSSFAAGEYAIRARIQRGQQVRESTAEGRITVDEVPTFQFTSPTSDVTLNLDPNSDDQIIIRWEARDLEGEATAEVGLDPDEDHDSGNEVVLSTTTLTAELLSDSVRFVGDDADDEPVDEGVYLIYALVKDDVNPQFFVDAVGRVTVPPRTEDENVVTEIKDPNDDKQFLESESALEIVFTINEPNDVLVDLKLDTDNNHSNGNELTILSQRLIAETVSEDRFSWNGNDTAGVMVPRTVYRLLLVVNRGDGVLDTFESEGFVFRRAAEAQPLIALLTPDADVNASAGTLVNITWRDDTGVADQESSDPNAPTIRLAIDDDRNPLPAAEEGDAEITILPVGADARRNAVGDGVQDTFPYIVPNTLEPGIYWIHAYIARPGMGDFETTSTAAGRVIVRDPNNP